jgi:ATP-binding cassette, subfamily B (MDR/TAP), member 1
MTLIFGNFVQAFLGFGASLVKAKAGDATAQEQILSAAAAFRHSMGKDSAALVYIGELTSHICTNHIISFSTPL